MPGHAYQLTGGAACGKISMPSKGQEINAPVAQLDRVPDYESVGRKFESCRAHHE